MDQKVAGPGMEVHVVLALGSLRQKDKGKLEFTLGKILLPK